MFTHTSTVNIPAYDASNNGLIITFKLTAMPSNEFFINSIGNIAQALQRNVKRIIEIMASMKKSWECLVSIGYLLECNTN